jgi:ABC-type transport system involved in multi-copper enzyme maturation permease subunit
MTFLPIVQRELRVAARRKTTFAIRGGVALLAIVMSGFLFLAYGLGMGGVQQAGASVFQTMSWYTLIVSLLAGVFLASDCLSEERREGTLGFLFLTDLKGYDVVLGKFAGVALNAFYSMLAILPVLSLCLLAGGVTGAEFWRMSLALVNTLFFAVAAAIWVSSNCQSAYRAMSATIALLLGFFVLTSITSALVSVIPRLSTTLFYMGAVSPVTAFWRGPEAGFSHMAETYWTSLAVSHLVGWMFLGLASWRVNFFAESARCSGIWQWVLRPKLVAGKTERRFELLEINPVLWLMDDSRRVRLVPWTLALAGASILICAVYLWPNEVWAFNSYLAWPFYFLLKLSFAIQACRFFAEARRAGALEMLCCTPITIKTMIAGQWSALRRIFLWPVIVLICVQFGSLLWAFLSTAAPRRPLGFMSNYFELVALKQMANSIADFFALGWFGMWIALSFKKPGAATGLTILYVLIIPAILFCVPTLATDAVFIVVGWTKLQEDFRRKQP